MARATQSILERQGGAGEKRTVFRRRRVGRSALLLVFILYLGTGLPGSLHPQDAGSGEDDGRSDYEMALSYLMAGETVRARDYFEKVLPEGGSFADLSRIELVRIMAASKDRGATLESALHRTLSTVEDPAFAPQAWYAAVQSLLESRKEEEALLFSLEMSRKFPESDRADDALFLASEIYYDRGAMAASLDTLFQLMARYPAGDSMDDAYYLLGKIYLTPGEYYSPARAVSAYTIFKKNLDKTVFASSIWKPYVLQTLRELSGG